jgi:galactokinase
MDPFVVLHGEPDAALLLDCRSMEHRAVPVDPARLALVVADSGVRHALADGEYEARRRECEEAAERLGVRSLRDADGPGSLPERLARRVRHVRAENERTLAAAAALEAGDPAAFGALLFESHRSLRDDYEVSCPELDALVDIARRVPGVLGSRMTGAGFGGSTVTAVRADAAEGLLAAFRDAGVTARRVRPSGSAGILRD